MRGIARRYMELKAELIQQGFAPEFDWQESADPEGTTNQVFLREAAWVILSGGMKEQVVRRIFGRLTGVFRGWTSTRWIRSNRRSLARKARLVVNNPAKIDAIIKVAATLAGGGLRRLMDAAQTSGPDAFLELPFMGPATSKHLAKNLGIPMSKPDRHLVHTAKSLGFRDPDNLCQSIACLTGEKRSVVDIVLWRSANLGLRPWGRLKLECDPPIRSA